MISKSENSKRKKPIIYLVDVSTEITGAFNCARNEAQLLSDYAEITLVLPAGSRIGKEHLVDFKKVIFLPIINIRKSFFSLIAYIPALIIAGWKLRLHMKRDRCNNLQINDFYIMHGVIASLFGFRGRIVSWVRMDPRRFGSLLSRIWLSLTFRHSDYVIAVSLFIRELLPDSPKVKLVHDPVLVRNKSKDKSLCNRKEGIIDLVYIGNYIEGKGQQYAIYAFAEIAAAYPDVNLHFYGCDMGLDKNRAYRRRLDKLSDESGFSDQIHFHGFVNDVSSVLVGSYAALNFSDSESFSLSCLEASYYGLPLVATRCGGPEEIVIDGKTGFLVPVGDISAMRKAIVKLLENKSMAQIMGDEGARLVKINFSPEQFLYQLKDVFGIQ